MGDTTQVPEEETSGVAPKAFKLKKKKMKIRVKKSVPLSVIALNMGQEILAAIYSGIANKSVSGLEAGDELDEVVDQYASKSGMSDEFERLSKIRLELKFGCDLSGSMFDRDYGRTIVPAMAAMRMFSIAFGFVREKLPQDVFKYSLWLWAVGSYHSGSISRHMSGHHTVCFDDFSMGTYVPQELKQYTQKGPDGVMPVLTSELLDLYLESVAMHEPSYSGGGTYLLPLIEGWKRWEEKYSDPQAHRLDIVGTDGMMYDTGESSKVQLDRRNGGKYEGVMLQLSRQETTAPEGLVVYQTQPQYLDGVVRDILLTFVQKVI